jgi:hypothetical protein
MEDKLSREHAFNFASLESEMNETVYQLMLKIPKKKRPTVRRTEKTRKQ